MFNKLGFEGKKMKEEEDYAQLIAISPQGKNCCLCNFNDEEICTRILFADTPDF